GGAEGSTRSSGVVEDNPAPKRKSRGKKSNDRVQADEAPQKRKRRSKKGCGKGTKKRRTEDNYEVELDPHAAEKSYNSTDDIGQPEGNPIGEASPATQEMKPSSIGGSDRAAQHNDSGSSLKGPSDAMAEGLSKGTPTTDPDKVERPCVDDNHTPGITEQGPAHPIVDTTATIGNLVLHIPEDDPIEVDYGDDTSNLGDAADDASVVFEEPPNGGDLFDDNDDDDDDALMEERDVGEATEHDINRPPVVLRPKPRPLSLSSIINDCMPLEDGDR
ncbi:hypothetical protein FOZ63_016400, partial [Perkinsus olseni]